MAGGARTEQRARASAGQSWAGGRDRGRDGTRWRKGEFELTFGADARLLGGSCARGVVGEGPLQLVRLDGRSFVSRPVHGMASESGVSLVELKWAG